MTAHQWLGVAIVAIVIYGMPCALVLARGGGWRGVAVVTGLLAVGIAAAAVAATGFALATGVLP